MNVYRVEFLAVASTEIEADSPEQALDRAREIDLSWDPLSVDSSADVNAIRIAECDGESVSSDWEPY